MLGVFCCRIIYSFCVVQGDIAKAMPDFVGYVSIKELCGSGSQESMPEWKDFTKIAGVGALSFDE